MVLVNIKEHEFYLDGYLKQKLDNIKEIINKNFDCVFLIDGDERIGKSTLGITCAYYISNGNFTVNNMCADSDDAVKKIENLPDKSVIFIDEGSLVFSSRDSMRKEQRKLIKIMNVVGQKNMVFIIVLPCFFDLNRQIAVRRSRFLLHCYADKKLNRGRFSYFGKKKKKMLFEIGKKNFDSYNKPKADFIGRFTNFNPFGKEYLETKKKSLVSSLHEDVITVKKENDIKMESENRIILNLELNGIKKGLRQVDKAELIGMALRTYKGRLKKLRDEGVLPQIRGASAS